MLFAAASCGGKGKETSSSSEGESLPAEEKTVYEKYAEVPLVYEKKIAKDEDPSLSLWFDHSFAKTVKSDLTGTGRDSYRLYAAKNEKENCQFFLSSETEDKTFRVKAENFLSESGATVPVTLYYQVYFEMEYNGSAGQVPDALPQVKENQSFTVEKNTSCGFVLQAQTESSTPAGDYKTTLEILGEDEKQLKIAEVYLKVWNYELSDDTECRTAMWIDKNFLYGMDYADVYDYLLSNRVNAYDLPYALSDGRVDAYLDNPRVNSFNILGFKYNKESGKTDAQIKGAMTAAYEKLSQKAEWLEKGYFYLVDEPNPNELYKLDWIRMYGEWLEECFPGYRQLSPFFTDDWIDDETDWIEYMRPYIRIWVPKTYAYTTLREYAGITGGKCLYKEGIEGDLDAAFGSYPKRIRQMKETDGAEGWWYVTSQPSNPYITFNTTEPGVAGRVLFWQQKLNGVQGLLYWSVNYWKDDGWNACANEWAPGQITYGNGQLIYPGNKVGSDLPVGSLRLESIRDGIEDYQAFCMLEKFVGTDAVNDLIRRTTTHVAKWSDDEDAFAAERIILGNWLEALSEAQ